MSGGSPHGSSPGRPRALFIRHDPDAHPGYVGDRLTERGFDSTSLVVAPSLAESNPTIDFGDPEDYQVIVPLGSIWSVYDNATIGNWIGAELEFLARAHSRGVPILGVCFGGQALSAALGGTVEPAPRPEVGWHTIDSDKPEVLDGGPWMQWHFDRFTVPGGATEVARSDAGPQAFTTGKSLGLQFHPEVSAEIVTSWLDGAPAEELDRPEVEVEEIRVDSQRLGPITKAKTGRLVDWFLDDIAGF